MPSFMAELDFNSLLLTICILTISIQVLILLFLFLIYLKNLFSRLLTQYIFERYEYYIMEASVDKVNRDSPIFKTADWIRNVLRVIIINKIMSLGGEARKGLVALYKDMGFEEKDKGLLNSKKWYHRLSALSALTVTRSELLRSAFPDLLKDKDLSVRVGAIKSISSFGISEYLPRIIECMSEFPDWVNERIVPYLLKVKNGSYEEIMGLFTKSPARVKRYIVPLLFEVDREQALWDTTENFDSYDYETQIAIVKSLGMIDSVEKIMGFVEKVMNDERWEIKAQLVKSLGVIRDERVIPLLEKGLDDRNWFVRYNSAVSIASFGERGLELLKSFSEQNLGFKSDISRYILDLARYGFLSDEM